jgi:hypothetical protein
VVHAGDVHVTDDARVTYDGVGVEVGGEVGAEGEHRGGGREEEVARTPRSVATGRRRRQHDVGGGELGSVERR